MPPVVTPSPPAPTPDMYIVNVEAIAAEIAPILNPKRDVSPRAVIDPGVMVNLGYVSVNNVTKTCANAAPYRVFNGQMFEVSTGLALSVNFGVPFMNFTLAAQGSISTRFEIVDDVLHWYNPQFFGGEAGFCVIGADIFATFTSVGRPVNCVNVMLVLMRG